MASDPSPDLPEPKEPKEPQAKLDKEPAAPTSPPTVKKTPLKTPREIDLEKKLSGLEDKVSTLESWQGEINDFLAELGLGNGKPVPITRPAPELRGRHGGRSLLDQIHADLYGED